MKCTVLAIFFTVSAFGQSVSGTAGQSAPGNKTDDQQGQTAKPKDNRGRRSDRKRSDATTVPPATTRTTPMDPSMPSDPKTPTSPTAPRTPVKPVDPTRPEDPTKPSNPPPVK